MARAECCWITKRSGPLRGSRAAGAGSGVAAKTRLAVYSPSGVGFCAGVGFARLPFDGRSTRMTSLVERGGGSRGTQGAIRGNVSRNERLFLQGVVGAFLSGKAACPGDAALLRRALPDGGDQQHLLPDAGPCPAGALGAGGA